MSDLCVGCTPFALRPSKHPTEWEGACPALCLDSNLEDARQ